MDALLLWVHLMDICIPELVQAEKYLGIVFHVQIVCYADHNNFQPVCLVHGQQNDSVLWPFLAPCQCAMWWGRLKTAILHEMENSSSASEQQLSRWVLDKSIISIKHLPNWGCILRNVVAYYSNSAILYMELYNERKGRSLPPEAYNMVNSRETR